MRAGNYDFIEIRAHAVRYAHLPSFLLLTKGFAFCYAKTRKLAPSGYPHFRCRSIPLCGTPLAVLLSLALFQEVIL